MGGVLQSDDVLARERLVCQQLFPVFGFDVELLNCLIGEDIASCFHGNNLGLVCKLLEKDWTVVLAFSILVKFQAKQMLGLQRLQRNMLLQLERILRNIKLYLASDWVGFELF